MAGGSAARTTIDEREVDKFSALAAEWWDPRGPFKPLHAFNPVRLRVIRDELCAHLGRDPDSASPLSGLRVLDVGCGGGLVCEPLTRLGAEVVGIDASERNVMTALAHARATGLDIDYRAVTVEALGAQGEAPFDAVLALEVVEHVADVPLFLSSCAEVLRPGGLLALATLNRTLRSLLTAKIGAEYVLGWLPRGTHDWSKFVPPKRAAAALAEAGLSVTRTVGMEYRPISGSWRVGGDEGVNYMVFAAKP